MKDFRDFIAACEREGILHRITAEVDWDLELSHVAKLNEDREGPVLLFERVTGHDMPVLASACTTPRKLALILGKEPDSSLVELMRGWAEGVDEPLPPRWVESGPCKENVAVGDAVDLNRFPSPRFYPGDGGRFFGTTAFVVAKDPDTGWVNLGVYRLQLLGERTLGTQFIKGKHADLILRKYAARGESMPVAAVIGGDPLLFLTAAARVPAQESEYGYAGALRGEPIEVVRGETVDLPIPATAEIVVEGHIDPNRLEPEGPFGEYSGYYSGTGAEPRHCIEVGAITWRDDPIFWATTVGRAVTDTHMIMALTYGASLWKQLRDMKIPGIRAVYCPPEGAGRYLAIVSVEQAYPGHVNQVGTAVLSTEMGAYGLKTVIVVDHDVDPWDIPRVLWAVSFRGQPNRCELIRRGRASPLDPSLPVDQREITGRLIIDATLPYEWKEKPVPVELDETVEARVRERWAEFGLQ